MPGHRAPTIKGEGQVMQGKPIHTAAAIPLMIGLSLMVASAFCTWVDVYNNFPGKPMFRVKVALTWISVYYPQGQDLVRVLDFFFDDGRTAMMSDFHGVQSWGAFEDQACGWREGAGGGHMHMFARTVLTGDVCDQARWGNIWTVLTVILVICAALLAMTGVVQFYTGQICYRERSYLFPVGALVCMCFVMMSAGSIGYLIFDMFDAERSFFPSWGFLFAFMALLACAVSVCMSCFSVQIDDDYEDYMAEKEEQAYLMEKAGRAQRSSYGQAQQQQYAGYGQQYTQGQAYAQPPGYGQQAAYGQQAYAAQPQYQQYQQPYAGQAGAGQYDGQYYR